MKDDLIGKRLGKYKIVEEIGRGGMATVYKALDTRLKRVVALKVLPLYLATDKALVARLKREAGAASRLNHPNIVDIYDVGEAEGHHYIAMRYVEGETLQGRLERIKGPLPMPEALNIFQQVASALEYAHSQGIIHRDIKPSNILLATDGRGFLSDFGIARAVEDTRLTRTGAAVGTPAYMSSEQGQGLRVDARSDIYALGIVLYEMTTGRVPFDADTPYATVFAQIHQAPPIPREFNPDLSLALQRVILKALAKNQKDRYQNIAQMRRAVERAAKSPALYERPTAVAPKGLGGRWNLTASRSKELPTRLRLFVKDQNIPPVLVAASGAIVVILCIVLSAVARPPITPLLVPTPSPTPKPLLAPTDTPTPVPTPIPTPTMTPTPLLPTSTPILTPTPRPTATPRPPRCFTGEVEQVVDTAHPLIQVQGYVQDENGNGIGGVVVRISAYEWSSEFGTWQNGYFAFDGLANAVTYILTLPGEQANSVDVPMRFGKRAIVIFTRGSCP